MTTKLQEAPRVDRLLGVRDVADRYGVGASTVRRTVVEAVTPLVADDPADDNDSERPISDAFDRSVEAINKLVRAYRTSQHGQVTDLTRERLPFSVPFITHSMDGDDWGEGLSLMMLHMNLPKDVAPEILNDNDLAKLSVLLILGSL